MRWKEEKEGITRIRELKEKIERLKIEEQQAERSGNLERVAAIRYGDLRQAETELAKLSVQADDKQRRMLKEEVDEEDVARIVSKCTGIPVSKMLEGEVRKLVNMEDRLRQRVVGQDEALQRVAEAEEQRRQQHRGDIGINAEQRIGEERGEHRRRQQRAVGEVDDVQDAVDQRQPERDQRVDRASHQAVEHRGDENYRRQHLILGGLLPRSAWPIPYAGIGNTGFAEANWAGRITWMSLPCTCVLTGAAPWFWPLTNFVGP